MPETPAPDTNPRTPLAVIRPPKPISKMTAKQRRAFADKLFDAMAATRQPAPPPET